MIDDAPALQKTLEDYVEARNKAETMIRQYYNLSESVAIYLNEFGRHLTPEATRIRMHIDNTLRDLDRSFWRRAFETTNFRELMDSEAKNQFDKDLDNNPPEFSIENIQTTFLALYQDADKMFRRGIVNVFKSLCYDYKTNKKEPFRVGEKIIMQYTTDSFRSSPRVHYGREQIISDIDRVFKVLAGEKHTPRALESALNHQWKENNGVYECDFFKVRAFKNGNSHWYFKRLDILDKVNELIADYYGSNILSN